MIIDSLVLTAVERVTVQKVTTVILQMVHALKDVNKDMMDQHVQLLQCLKVVQFKTITKRVILC